MINKEYLGDGATHSFNNVKEADPCKKNGIILVELECVGHVQKRLGTCLRNLVKTQKGLTNQYKAEASLLKTASIQCKTSMVNHHPIRSNVGNLYSMKKAIHATLFHFTDLSHFYTCHQFCPLGKYSWPKYLGFKSKELPAQIYHTSMDRRFNSTNH